MEEEAMRGHAHIMPSTSSHHSLFVTPKQASNVTSKIVQSAGGHLEVAAQPEKKQKRKAQGGQLHVIWEEICKTT